MSVMQYLPATAIVLNQRVAALALGAVVFRPMAGLVALTSVALTKFVNGNVGVVAAER